MQWHLPYYIPPVSEPVSYGDGILLQGSCFTEHIGEALKRLKFNVLVNPGGIAFDPLTISHHFQDYRYERKYSTEDLIFNDGLNHSYHHHGIFSHKRPKNAIQKIEQQTRIAAKHLRKTSLLIITPGTAFVYRHKQSERFVANCHKIPAGEFEKKLMSIADIEETFDSLVRSFFELNEQGRVVFTVSPVRHIRDGLVENNHSKARLLVAVHRLADRYDRVHYFPAYELLIDVLRDYRFFGEDGVHPTQQAAKFIFDAFAKVWISGDSLALSRKVSELMQGIEHRPLHPETDAHKKFIANLMSRWQDLKSHLPEADWSDVASYFERV